MQKEINFAPALKIRNVPVEVVNAHKMRAKETGLSMEEYLRHLLRNTALVEPKQMFAKKMRQRHEVLQKKLTVNTTELLRQERDES